MKANALEPHVSTALVTALVVNGRFQLGSTILPSELLERAGYAIPGHTSSAETATFGFKIPHLPDASLSSHSVAATPKDRVAEALQRQTALIGSLEKWKNVAFSLRYIWLPEKGQIEIAVLAKGIFKPGLARSLALQANVDAMTAFTTAGFRPEPVWDEAELARLLSPVSFPYLIEIRQREDILEMVAGGAYVVYPFRPPTTTWIPTFETLVSQTAPCVVNVHYQPTLLLPFEQDLLADAAQLADSVSEIDLSTMYLTRRGRVSDPIARIVARLYTDWATRLADPALTVIQIGCEDPHAARTVAQALKSEISEQQTVTELKSDQDLPSGCELVFPQSAEDQQAARRTLSALELTSWGTTTATPGKERLRYLVDKRAATAALRFPIPVRGGVPGMRTKLAIPNYYTGPIKQVPDPHEYMLGDLLQGDGIATMPVAQLSRHGLIAGFTGTGKTTTCMHLLDQIERRGIPYLVIEPIKSEYRSLIASNSIHKPLVFTLGDEGTSPFRLNPLEILPGIRVESHISAILACLEAALPTFAILPSILEESLINVYLSREWELSDRGKTNDQRQMPTLGDLYAEIIQVTNRRDYTDKTQQDIRAAATGRIGSLLRGGKGRMLNTRRSSPIAEILSVPTVLELTALNDEEKALVILFLVTAIREHCHVTRKGPQIKHVTLIEEAHRVMSATPQSTNREVSADTQAQAARIMGMALSEIRGVGEGFLIAEQIPTRLSQDALKNTNLKIIHRLPGEDDREVVGKTANVTAEQQIYLGVLEAGYAAVSFEGVERPFFIHIPNFKAEHQLPDRVSDEIVETHMQPYHESHKDVLLPFNGCRHCQRQCRYRDRITPVAYEPGASALFTRALDNYQAQATSGSPDRAWVAFVDACTRLITPSGLGTDRHAAYCLFSHLWDGDVEETLADRFFKAGPLEA